MKKLLSVLMMLLMTASQTWAALPHTFATEPGPVPLSYLDDNFSYLNALISSGVAPGGAIQLGSNITMFCVPGTNCTYPQTSYANLSVVRTSSSASVPSIGLEVTVGSPAATLQYLTGVSAGVLSNVSSSGWAAGMFTRVESHSDSTSAGIYGNAIDVLDKHGNNYIRGIHLNVMREVNQIQNTYGLEVMANGALATNYTVAMIIDKMSGTTDKWGVGLFADNASIGNYFLALAPFAKLGLTGTISDSAYTFYVDKDGKTLTKDITISAATDGTYAYSAISFQSGWGAVGGYSTPGYWKDPFGICHVKGVIACSGCSSAYVGRITGSSCQPSTTIVFPPGGNVFSGREYVEIRSGGYIYASGISSDFYSLDGITFPMF